MGATEEATLVKAHFDRTPPCEFVTEQFAGKFECFYPQVYKLAWTDNGVILLHEQKYRKAKGFPLNIVFASKPNSLPGTGLEHLCLSRGVHGKELQGSSAATLSLDWISF